MQPPVFQLSVGTPLLRCLLISLACPKPSSLSSPGKLLRTPTIRFFGTLRVLQLKRNANLGGTCEEACLRRAGIRVSVACIGFKESLDLSLSAERLLNQMKNRATCHRSFGILKTRVITSGIT